MKNFITPFLLTLLLASCRGKAEVTVQNKVHSAALTQISWDGHPISSSLLPGQTSSPYTIQEESDRKFPRQAVLKFYMNRDGNQVYLETKQSFMLGADDHLLIVVSDTTQVVNPAM